MFAKYPRAVPGLIGRSDAGIHVVPVAIDEHWRGNLKALLDTLKAANLQFAIVFYDRPVHQMFLGLADELGAAFDTKLINWCMANHVQLLDDKKVTFWSGDFSWDLNRVQSDFDYGVMRFMRDEAKDWLKMLNVPQVKKNMSRTLKQAHIKGVTL